MKHASKASSRSKKAKPLRGIFGCGVTLKNAQPEGTIEVQRELWADQEAFQIVAWEKSGVYIVVGHTETKAMADAAAECIRENIAVTGEVEPVPPVPWGLKYSEMKALLNAVGEHGLVQLFISVLSRDGQHVKVSLTKPRPKRNQ